MSIQFSSVTVLMLQNLSLMNTFDSASSSTEDSAQFSLSFVLFSSNSAQHCRLQAVMYQCDWCVNVWCCCCFPGLPRVSHHLSDTKAGQHASVLHRSRAEIIVRHCVSTLTHSSLAHSLTHSFSLLLHNGNVNFPMYPRL